MAGIFSWIFKLNYKCKHKWSAWEYKVSSENEHWRERYCLNCGLIEELEDDGTSIFI